MWHPNMRKNTRKNATGNHPLIWIKSDVFLSVVDFQRHTSNKFKIINDPPPDPREATAMPEAIASPSHMH